MSTQLQSEPVRRCCATARLLRIALKVSAVRSGETCRFRERCLTDVIQKESSGVRPCATRQIYISAAFAGVGVDD